jgi:hypothetical protein
MKKILAILFAVTLAGCSSTSQLITKEKMMVVEPDKSLYNCPVVPRFPNPDTLTDVEVAKLLVLMERNNSECRRNIKAIQTFIEQAKARLNQN